MKKLGTNILLSTIIITITSMLLLIFVNWYFIKDTYNEVGKSMVEGLKESVNIVNGDNLEVFINNKDTTSKEFDELQQELFTAKEKQGITYSYILIKNGDKFEIIAESYSHVSTIGNEYDSEPAMSNAFEGNGDFSEPIEEEGQVLISAYGPIKNSQGETIAILGIDEDVTRLSVIETIVMRTLVIMSIIVLFLYSILGIKFSRYINKKMKALTDGLEEMAEGNFSVEIDVQSKDEFEIIGKYINKVRVSSIATLEVVSNSNKNQNTCIQDLLASSEEIGASAEEVSVTIENISEQMKEQAEEIANIDNIVEMFGESIDKAVTSIDIFNKDLKNVNENIIATNRDLQDLQNTNDNIRLSYEDMNFRVKTLSNSLKKIGEIANFIDSIAGQTNMLALNASIEASRVGESGKGFLVVANQVRKLAEEVKNSSVNIKELLGSISNESDVVLETSENMSERIGKQHSVLGSSVESFRGVTENISCIIPQVNEINESMKKINNDKNEIVNKVDKSREVSEEVSSSGIEIAAASEEVSSTIVGVTDIAQQLTSISQDMQEAINKFKIQ